MWFSAGILVLGGQNCEGEDKGVALAFSPASVDARY